MKKNSLNVILISIIGLCLLLITVSLLGDLCLVNLNPEVPQRFVSQKTYTQGQRCNILPELFHKPGEVDLAYFQRLTMDIHQVMINWNNLNSGYCSVSLFDNWLMYADCKILGKPYYIYEYRTPKYALRRGFGICTQVSIVAMSILQDQGYEASTVFLRGPTPAGHTVAVARTKNGQEAVLDPHYGVFVPSPLSSLENNPHLVRDWYKNRFGPEKLEELVEIFKPQGNKVWLHNVTKRRSKEMRLHQLKYIIPVAVLLLSCSALFLLWRRRKQ